MFTLIYTPEALLQCVIIMADVLTDDHDHDVLRLLAAWSLQAQSNRVSLGTGEGPRFLSLAWESIMNVSRLLGAIDNLIGFPCSLTLRCQ